MIAPQLAHSASAPPSARRSRNARPPQFPQFSVTVLPLMVLWLLPFGQLEMADAKAGIPSSPSRTNSLLPGIGAVHFWTRTGNYITDGGMQDRGCYRIPTTTSRVAISCRREQY
jgi:hypothetical protein